MVSEVVCVDEDVLLSNFIVWNRTVIVTQVVTLVTCLS